MDDPRLYRFAVENFATNLDEMLPLYAEHYEEMRQRLAQQGVRVPPMNLRLDIYKQYSDADLLISYTARTLDGAPVGYVNAYLSNDMHNGEFIGLEDAVFVREGHRNGVGKELIKFSIEDMRQRGVRRLHVDATADTRVEYLLKRMGFKPRSICMVYHFD